MIYLELCDECLKEKPCTGFSGMGEGATVCIDCLKEAVSEIEEAVSNGKVSKRAYGCSSNVLQDPQAVKAFNDVFFREYLMGSSYSFTARNKPITKPNG